MTDSYYLINDQIKFYFNIENLRIEFNGQQQSLEPKEARILKYVLENQVDGLIKSEAILDDNWDYWSDKKVLQKVLSTLRKKFKNLGVTENGFVAADSNYKINYNAVLVNEAEQAQKRSRLLLEKTLKYLKTLVPVAIILMVAVFVVGKVDLQRDFSVSNIIQATTIDGVSVEPALSSDGRAMAFSHKRDGQSQIFIKLDANLNYQVLTDGPNDQVPSWSPSGKRLAFQRRVGQQCEIRMLTLDEHYSKAGQDSLVAECSSVTDLTSIAWKDENNLFFTESKQGELYREIKLLNVETGEVTPYYTQKPSELGQNIGGSGPYFIVYNRKLDSLFALQSPNWSITTVNRVNDDNSMTFLREVGGVLWSFDIFENQVIFKDLDNQLKSFDIDSPQKLTTIYKNPLKRIAYPRVSPNSNKIAIVSGSVFKSSLHRYDFETGTSSEVFTADTLLNHLQEIDGELFYVSDETGIRQIYSYKDGYKSQITNLIRNDFIVKFSVSNNKKWLAIAYADRTTVYAIHDSGLTELKTFPLSSSPAFSPNSERILLVNWVGNVGDKAAGMEKALIEYYVDGFVETGISIRNAKFGIYHAKGIIFPTNDNKVKLFRLNGIDTILESHRILTSSAMGISGNSLVLVNYIGTNRPRRIDLDTMEQTFIDAPILGDIATNDNELYYLKRHPGSMSIFKGELTEM